MKKTDPLGSLQRSWRAFLYVTTSVMLGFAVVNVPASVTWSQVALAIGATCALALALASGPGTALALLVGLGLLNLTPSLTNIGAADFRLDDVIYVALMLWWASDSRTRLKTRRRVMRFTSFALFLLLIGLSVALVAIDQPHFLPTSLASYLRLLQTASVAGLTAWTVVRSQSLKGVTRGLIMTGLVGVSVAGYQALSGTQVVGNRFGGLLNQNALGLVSGLLVVTGMFNTNQPRWARLLSGISGMLGLFLSRSIGSLAGTLTAVVVGIVILTENRRKKDRAGGWVPMAVGAGFVMIILLAGLVAMFRPETLPSAQDFRHSSVTHRLILGVAGWEIFLDQPLVGVGWQRSASPDVIGDDQLAARLQQQFPHVNSYLYPRITPTNVHNGYIQLLAELGGIGFGFFLIAAMTMGRGIRKTLRMVAKIESLWRETLALALGLVLVLVWWNDNAIYGGQTESVAAALLIGALSAAASLSVGEADDGTEIDESSPFRTQDNPSATV